MSFDAGASPSWDRTSFQSQSDTSMHSGNSASRWLAPSEDLLDSFVHTASFSERKDDDDSDLPLDYSDYADILTLSNANDTVETAGLSALRTCSDEAQEAWRGPAVVGNDSALPNIYDAFSANYAPSGSFLSSESDLLSLDLFDSQETELDLVALPSSPSPAPDWTTETSSLEEISADLFIPKTRRGRPIQIEQSNRNATYLLRRLRDSSPSRGRQLARPHTMLARRWEDPTHMNQMRSKSLSGQQELESSSQLSHTYYPYRENGALSSPNKLYLSRTSQLEADSVPLDCHTIIPEDAFDNFEIKRSEPTNSPIGSPTFDSAMADRSSFHDAQPGLTFSSYPSTPRSHAEGPSYPMTPPQTHPTESQQWKQDQADAPQGNKAEEWWNEPIDQLEVACGAPTTTRISGLGISNIHTTNLSSRVAFPNARLFTPGSMAPTPSHSRYNSYSDGASALFDQMYAVPTAQMMPMHQQQRMMQQRTLNHNHMPYQTIPTTISPAQMSSQPFASPLPFLHNSSRASSLARTTRDSSIAFSRASSYTRSSPSPSPAPQTRAQHRKRSASRKYNRRSSSRATSACRGARGAGKPAAAETGGFINFTPSDKKRILTGVAPSGSSKTKARREKEAMEQKRKMSEAARKAVLMGDMALLDRSGL